MDRFRRRSTQQFHLSDYIRGYLLASSIDGPRIDTTDGAYSIVYLCILQQRDSSQVPFLRYHKAGMDMALYLGGLEHSLGKGFH